MADPSVWVYVPVTLTAPPIGDGWVSEPFVLTDPPIYIPPPVWHGPRKPGWRIEILDLTGNVIGDTLTTKTGAGTLTWVADQVSPGGGSIALVGTINGATPGVALRGKRLRPIYTLNGVDYPQGLFKPSRIPTTYSPGTATHNVSLVSATSVTGHTRGALTYPPATPIVTTVRSLAANAGVQVSITDGDETLRTEASFADNTPIQTVCDTLLEAAGYTPLRPTLDGVLRSAPFVPAGARAVAFEFRNDAQGIYRPTFTVDTNWLQIPNRVRAVARSSSTAASLVGYATDEHPNSPWSYQNRGEWIEETVTDVDATSQEALNLIAARELAARQQTAATMTFECAWVPALQLGAVVGFDHTKHALSGLWEITGISWAMSATSLVSVTARSVA